MDPFKKIAEKTIRDAENVKCSVEEFKKGLATIWHEINNCLEMHGVDPRDPEYLGD